MGLEISRRSKDKERRKLKGSFFEHDIQPNNYWVIYREPNRVRCDRSPQVMNGAAGLMLWLALRKYAILSNVTV